MSSGPPATDPFRSDGVAGASDDPATGWWCRCGATSSHPSHPQTCADSLAALEHTDRVGRRADALVSRLAAARAMGTAFGEVQPLATFQSRDHGQPGLP
ncbi:hypothetical protein [Pedococcus sp. 5OH_020]|uniref:hypothetical protein n=1 Tax=Pedococcus sp. 5OH_020 TaxID=2989814 RepID=UPI0022E9F557|nr:hypothetical protein [Pedococcus sp. 5OH_020]